MGLFQTQKIYLPLNPDYNITLLVFLSFWLLHSFFVAVLTCDAVPEIENSEQPPFRSPYLAGKSVVEYQCKDRYKFKAPEYNSTKCIASINEEGSTQIDEHGNIQTKWLDVAKIKCIPGNLWFFLHRDTALKSIQSITHNLSKPNLSCFLN